MRWFSAIIYVRHVSQSMTMMCGQLSLDSIYYILAVFCCTNRQQYAQSTFPIANEGCPQTCNVCLTQCGRKLPKNLNPKASAFW